MAESKLIKVTFLEKETNEILMEQELGLDELPESFPKGAILDLGDDEWLISSTTPKTKKEFTLSGKLEVILENIDQLDPEDLLYSIPTINDELPDFNDKKAVDGDELLLHEDDWRNIELTSSDLDEKVNELLTAVLQIHEEHGSEEGFAELFVRENFEHPLKASKIPMKALDIFEKAHTFSGIAFLEAEHPVKNSFAFETKGGIIFYGRVNKDVIEELCIDNCEPNDHTPKEVALFATFMEKYDCKLVDWCMTVQFPFQSEHFESYFLETFQMEEE